MTVSLSASSASLPSPIAAAGGAMAATVLSPSLAAPFTASFKPASAYSSADAAKLALPSVVSAGLLPSASLSSPSLRVGPTSSSASGGSASSIAHIPLSLARRQLSSASSEAVSHRLRQHALLDQLTGAFVAWQQQAVDEYSQILQRCKKDANSRIAQLSKQHSAALAANHSNAGIRSTHTQPTDDGQQQNRQPTLQTEQTHSPPTSSSLEHSEQQQPQQQRQAQSGTSASSVAASADCSIAASAASAESGGAQTDAVSDVTRPSISSARSDEAAGTGTDGDASVAMVAAAAAEVQTAIDRQREAAEAVRRSATAMGLLTLPADCQPPLHSLHSLLGPWLTARSALAARVQAIKQTQSCLQAEKARLTAWKDAIKQQQQQQPQSGGAEQLREQSVQWEAAKQQLAADGARLKDEHADYERRIAEYKAEEATIRQTWALIERQANESAQTDEAAPLPTADKLSSLVSGLQQLQLADQQLVDANTQLTSLTAQQHQLQQTEQRQQEPQSPAAVALAATTAADGDSERDTSVELTSKQPTDTIDALSAAERQIREQHRQLTELKKQLAIAQRAEQDSSANTAPTTSLAPTTYHALHNSGTAAAEAEAGKAEQQPTSVSLLSSAAPSSGLSCSSCDGLLVRCSALQASLSQSAADLSVAAGRLSAERDRHAAAEAEWQRVHSASAAGVPGAAEAEIARHAREAGERQLQLEDLSRLLDETVRKGNRELNESRASQQRLMEEAVSTLERQQANERQQWSQQLEASVAAGSEQAEARAAVELRLAEEERKRRETDAQLTAQRAAFEALQAEAADALQRRDGLLAQLSSATADIERLHGVIAAERQKAAEAEAQRVQAFERMLEEQKRRKEFQFKYEDAKGKVRVYARVRPFTAAEVAAREKTLLRPGRNEWTLELNETQRDVLGHITDKWREFAFDHVFHAGLLPGTAGNGSQVEVFNETASFAELSLQGINCCVFAYGQSGTGKTWTMAGLAPSSDNGHSRELLGLKPRMIERVYELAGEMAAGHDVTLSCYMVEIYLNALEDLFWKLDTATAMRGKEGKWPDAPELKVRADGGKKKVQIDNIRIKAFHSAADMLQYCDAAEKLRRVRKTGLNEASSRSHLVFAIMSECTNRQTGKTVKGKLSLVDLAGSERADKTNVDGLSKASRDAMLEEGVAINESLRMLKNVFRILGTAHLPLAKGQKAEIVQYRGNMLTELMQDSLGGNAKTLMFVNVGPAASNISESIDSLQYGDFVKNITNEKATADEDYTEQIRRLKETLQLYKDKYGEMGS